MDKFQQQLIISIILITIGVAIGAAFTVVRKNKELDKLVEKHKKDLSESIKNEQLKRDSLSEQLSKLDSIYKVDSVIMHELNNKIKREQVKTEKLRNQMKKLSSYEKTKWLIDRYSNTTAK